VPNVSGQHGQPGTLNRRSVGLRMVTRPYVDNTQMNWSRTGPRPLRTAIWYPVDFATKRAVEIPSPRRNRWPRSPLVTLSGAPGITHERGSRERQRPATGLHVAQTHR